MHSCAGGRRAYLMYARTKDTYVHVYACERERYAHIAAAVADVKLATWCGRTLALAGG